MNQLVDFNQICMDITFGHDKKLNSFDDLDLIFKVTARLQAKMCLSACYLIDHWMKSYQICKPIQIGQD